VSVPVITSFGSHANLLGESPVWDPASARLWWVDVCRNQVLAADADGALKTQWTFDRPVGSIGLAEDGLVAAFADGFGLIDRGGAVRRLARPVIEDRSIRFNDGKADRQGRFLSGTMQHGGPEEPALATLWRLERSGAAAQLVDGLRLANAICFSPCGRWLYFADSVERVIRRHAYDPASGDIGPRTDFFDCAAFDLVPDGATVDSQGRLWVAMVLSGQIACISPEGALIELIDLPLPFPSCPAFGGADMATLFVTTIRDSGRKLKSDLPDAGRMLAISGLDAHGIIETRFVPDNHIRN
jgi:L-arabinonolactonase